MLKAFSKAIEGAFSTKSNWDTIENLLIEYGFGGGGWTQYNYPAFAVEGYSKNVIVNHCINTIADSVADLPYIVKINNTDVTDSVNPITQLLKRPNPLQSYKEFIRYVIAYKMIAGNSYIRSISMGAGKSRVFRLESLRPDWMTITPNSFQEPLEYIYTVAGASYSYPVDQATYLSEILQLKIFNPINNIYGLSPIQVAMLNVDQHNQANLWNFNLLRNQAKPSGLISVKAESPLNKTQRTQIEERLRNYNQGAKGAGTPFVMGADLSWTQTSLTPAEMDWVNSKGVTARDICLAFKFPAFLLGMAEGATFTNMGEAKLSFYEETVIPLGENTLSELAYYISRMMGINLELSIDKDKVTALVPRRTEAIENAVNLVSNGIITINEGRSTIDWDKFKSPNADTLMIPAGKLPIDFSTDDLDAGNDPDAAEPASDPAKSKPIDNLIKSLSELKEHI